MQESFIDLVKGQEKKNNIIQCTVLRKFTRGKNEFLKVDAGMKTEGIVNLKEFEIEPVAGDKIDLIIVETYANELVMSFKKVKLEQTLTDLRELQKSKKKTPVLIKDKIPVGYKVTYNGFYGILNCSIQIKENEVEVFIAKVFKDGFYCFLDTKKASRSSIVKNSVVDCQIEKRDSLYAFVKISGQEKLEGIIDIKEIKSDRDVKAQIIYVEGIKAILSTVPLKKLEMKKILQKLQIEHDNSLKVKGRILEVNKEGATVTVGSINCFVPLKDLFWISSINDPKIDLNFYQKDETYHFHIKDMTIHWKSKDGIHISTEMSYGINTLIDGFNCEMIDENTITVGDLTFDVNCQQNTPMINKEHNFNLDSISLVLKTAMPNNYISFEKKYPEDSLVKGIIVTDPSNKREVFVDVEGVSCQLNVFEIDWDLTLARKKFYSFKAGEEIQATVKHINVDRSVVYLTLKSPRSDEFYSVLRSLQKGKTYDCKVEEIMLNQFKKIKRLKISIADDPKYEGIFGFIMRMDLSPQKRIEVGDIVRAKFLKKYNQELLFSQKAVEQEENTRVAKMIAKINEGEGEAFSSLEEHFNLF